MRTEERVDVECPELNLAGQHETHRDAGQVEQPLLPLVDAQVHLADAVLKRGGGGQTGERGSTYRVKMACSYQWTAR